MLFLLTSGLMRDPDLTTRANPTLHRAIFEFRKGPYLRCASQTASRPCISHDQAVTHLVGDGHTLRFWIWAAVLGRSVLLVTSAIDYWIFSNF